jgi:phenylpropionate dioxygenase-like ring-hydroxylating dioxygenase large terminal subunit
MREGWYPIAACDDLPAAHIYQTQLCDEPLAVWRAADGHVNVWQDRCPHRGVRFSIGTVHANELRCRYHAWRFGSGSGACTFVPAHPDRKPADAIRATAYPSVERAGLVWTRLAGDQAAPPVLLPSTVPMRAMPVNRAEDAVVAAISAAEMPGVHLFVQPVSAGRTVIRGLAEDAALLGEHDDALERLRRTLESA